MILLFRSGLDRSDLWRQALRRQIPDIEVRAWPDVGDPTEIDYALVWRPPPGFLGDLPRLKAVFSLGAGVDHLAGEGVVPPGLPVVRMVDDGLTRGMTEYVVMQVLSHHRRMIDYRIQQARREWKELPPRSAASRVVGILGLGVLGGEAARALVSLGFDVRGWSRSPKAVAGVRSFAGAEALDAFLAETEILVCLLPLTDETRGILNAALFAKLPKGASLINVGRGGHLMEDDLIPALDAGQLDSATLDVFTEEPLAQDHPFWGHPRIVMTPHVASITDPETGSIALAENLRRMESGLPPLNVVDPGRGY